MNIVIGLLLAVFNLISAEVTVLRMVQVICDKSPKLRIRGSGFDAEASDITLELGSSGQLLTKNRDYLITVEADGDGLILNLLGNRK